MDNGELGAVTAVMRRLIRGLWSAFWLVVLLIGLPAVLVGYVGWPLPDHPPTEADWQRWAEQPLTRSALVGAVAMVGWLLWALLVYAVVVEVLNRARRAVGWLGRLRLPALPTPMQATASGMLGVAAFGVPTGTAHPPAPPAANLPATAPASPADAVSDGAAALPAGRPTIDRHTGPGHAANRPAQPAGVDLPGGGWLTDDTAGAIAAAATLVWLRRRRRYRPRPPVGAARDDPDLAPLPATVTAVQDGLRRQHATDDEPETEHTPGVADTDPAAGTAATIGQRDGAPLGLDDLPASGVGLTGPGAAAAARGLLAAVLLSGRPPGQRPQVVATATELRTLLGPNADRLPDVPGLDVVDNLDDAIAHLEDAALTRGQPTAIPHDHDRPNLGGPAAGAARSAPLVLLAGSPADPAAARRLAVILTLATPLRITGVLIGAWPHGTTWQVAGDGTTTGPRLSVLTAAATTDLLTLAREAHTDPDQPPAPPTQARRPARSTRASHTGPPAALRLRLRVLGTPTLHHDGDHGEPVRITRSAALQILVFLAVHRAGATSGELAGAMWPGMRPRPTDRLYTPVSVLRGILREAAGTDVIVRDGDRYRLDDQHIDVDLWRLHAAVERAATALDPADRQHALRAVIDTYTGELAAGRPWPWLAPHREAARRHVVDAYAALAATETDPHAALVLLQDAIRTDPFNEELHRRAIHGYAAAGDPAAARRLLATLTARLAEAGIEPGDDIRQLAAE